jgi:hypothetical protein
MLLQAHCSMRLFWSNSSERSGDVSRTCGPGPRPFAKASNLDYRRLLQLPTTPRTLLLCVVLVGLLFGEALSPFQLAE